MRFAWSIAAFASRQREKASASGTLKYYVLRNEDGPAGGSSADATGTVTIVPISLPRCVLRAANSTSTAGLPPQGLLYVFLAVFLSELVHSRPRVVGQRA